MSETVSAPAAASPGLVAALRNMVRPQAASIEKDIDFAAPGAARLGRDVGTFDPVRLARLDSFTRAVVFVVTLLTFGGARALGLQIEPGGLSIAIGVVAFMLAAAWLYSTARPAPRLAAGTLMVAELIYYGIVFIVFSYVMLAAAGPERAPVLSRIDQALGFDWKAYTDTLSASPRLLAAMEECYGSIAWQDFLIPTCLLLWGRLGWLRVFMNGFALGATATVLIAFLVPAIDARALYTLDLSDARHLVSGFRLTDDYLQVRDGRLVLLDMDRLTGIVSFPSFHTYLALLFLVGSWPLRKLWWCLLPVNVLLIASTPKFGFHYLVDVVGGFAVAALVLGATMKYLRVRPPAPAA